jgi:hypothetical protein
MLKLEIAGQTILYKNAFEMTYRIQERLDSIRAQRLRLDEQRRALRWQERALEKFLGVSQVHAAENKEASGCENTECQPVKG